jgi:hypothetical protein
VLLTAGLVAVLALSGCQAELPDDGPGPEESAAAARRFAEKAVAAGQVASDTGRFEITVTDEEVTSFLNVSAILLRQTGTVALEELDQIQDIPELEGVDIGQWQELLEQRERLPGVEHRRLRLRLVLEEPAVYFRGNGHMIARGNARLLVLQLPVRFVAAPLASEGELVLDFVEGQLGSVPMPEILFDSLGAGLSRALLFGREYAEITEIRVNDGVLTISGRWNR